MRRPGNALVLYSQCHKFTGFTTQVSAVWSVGVWGHRTTGLIKLVVWKLLLTVINTLIRGLLFSCMELLVLESHLLQKLLAMKWANHSRYTLLFQHMPLQLLFLLHQVINCGELLSKWVGESTKNIESIFEEAQSSDAILVFDEAEGLFGQRTTMRLIIYYNTNLLTSKTPSSPLPTPVLTTQHLHWSLC